MFEKVKGLYDLQKKARALQAELKKMEFASESKGITVVANGAMEITAISAEENAWNDLGQKKFLETLLDLANKSVKKGQESAAVKMKDITGSLGLPGM